MPMRLPRWIAHRGGGSLAPENTLAGIRLAARLGYRAVEFDVMLSGDGTPVLIHDETLERTTNGVGRVSETPDAELFALDAGCGERVPRFSEAANLCRQLGLLANVEIKPAHGHEVATAEVVAGQCAALWRDAVVPPLLSSFSSLALEIARDLAPGLARGLLVDRVPVDWPEQLRRLQAMALHCNAAWLSDEVLAEARARQVPVLTYTVNAPDRAKNLLAAGVAAVFTDRLDLFADDAGVADGEPWPR